MVNQQSPSYILSDPLPIEFQAQLARGDVTH